MPGSGSNWHPSAIVAFTEPADFVVPAETEKHVQNQESKAPKRLLESVSERGCPSLELRLRDPAQTFQSVVIWESCEKQEGEQIALQQRVHYSHWKVSAGKVYFCPPK